jgi:hypothetical protein
VPDAELVVDSGEAQCSGPSVAGGKPADFNKPLSQGEGDFGGDRSEIREFVLHHLTREALG